MAGADFQVLVDSGLLREVEEIVVESHRRLHSRQDWPWSRPIAYRWLRYEDPMPVTRLADGLRRLCEAGGAIDPEPVEKACAKASEMGFSN